MSYAFNPSSQFAVDGDAPASKRRPARWGAVSRLFAALFGSGRKTRSRADSSPANKPPPDWDHEIAAMVATGDQMLARARRQKLALSVAVFDLKDLRELKTVFGSRVAQEVLARVTDKFQRLVASKGVVVRTGPTMFTVLLPGYGRDRALAAIREVMGHPCRIELEGSDDEIVLVPDFSVQTVRAETNSISAVYATLQREIVQAHELEQTRRRYLQRERESHTRPMDLRADPESLLAPDREPVFHSAATIPMPLSAQR